jgi:long-chain acyl-CoA synthetase
MGRIELDPVTTLVDVVTSFPSRGSQESIHFYNGYRVFRYTYEELYTLCLRCAALLTRQGLLKGDKILLWAPNSPEWIILQCACALNGIISVPLDIRNDPTFIGKIQHEVEAKCIFRTQYKQDPGLTIPTVYMESLLDLIDACPSDKPTVSVSPEDWMSIFYTSGTTGRPKGVILTHENIADNINSLIDIIPVDKTYHLLSVLPLSHAFEQTCGFWSPLYGGATVLYLKTLKPSALFEMFQRQEITVMLVVPRLLGLLKQSIEHTLKEKHMEGYLRFGLQMGASLPRFMRRLYFYPIHKKIGKTFKFFVSGGAYLPRDIEVFWRGLGFDVVQGYGLTECSPILTAHAPGKGKIGSVGHAIGNNQLQINPDHEIMAKGKNIFQGYFKQPEATASVFVDGWFKTGDVVDLDEDQYIFIRSRKKDIIVTGDGVNVYPEDIEGVLNAVEGIKESCVVGIGEQEDRVHAELIMDETADMDSCIKKANQQLSPEQQIESWGHWHDKEFPKTTTLKIKKNDVRNVISLGATSRKMESQLPMGTPLQQILGELGMVDLQILTPEAKLGQDIGLSSIDRVELISRMEEEFRLDIDDHMVTAETTIAELETMIQKRERTKTQLPFRRWTLSLPCHLIREAVRHTLIHILLKMFCRIECTGLENVQTIKNPVLFVANHTSHIDTPLIMHLVPNEIGSRICPAASKEYFDTEGEWLFTKISKFVSWNLTTTLINIFPMAQTKGYRQSIAYAGELMDKGWSVLLFPEGTRTEAGEIAEFQQGVGLMVRALQVPLVPVAIYGGEQILHRGKFLPKRGVIKIVFGKPFIPTGKSYNEITMEVKARILELFTMLKSK